VLVWGVNDVEPLEPLELLDELDEGTDRDDDQSSDSDDSLDSRDVAEVWVLDLALEALASLHAIAPPSESAATTLAAATARRVRCALGLRRGVSTVAPGSGGRGLRSGPTVRTPGKTEVSGCAEAHEDRGGTVAVDRFPVEAGHILMFARAVGDPNPVYSDAEYAAGTEVGGIVAPPTFAQASAQFDPDYVLRPKIGEPWFGSGREATGIKREPSPGGAAGGGGGMGRGLHAEQHFEYHRHLRPGDVLSATTRPGDRWEREGRSGTLRFSETITEYRDQDGELVITARGVGVVTERPVTEESE
jgi:hypothetical protein